MLIYSSLEKLQSDDLQISKKLVFMQEIAFYMWKKRISTVTKEEIDDIASRYATRHLLPLPVSLFLRDLQEY